jgi:dephospho-CoA kinase
MIDNEMNVIQIAGVSGSGKSSVARRLIDMGYNAVNTDSVPGLCFWTDDRGVPIDRPEDPDREWLEHHVWTWNANRFDRLLEEAKAEHAPLLFVCGIAENDLMFRSKFDLVILLDIDESTMLERVVREDRRTKFGRSIASQQALVDWFPATRARYLTNGAHVVDATTDLETVIDRVLTAVLAFLDDQDSDAKTSDRS